MTRRAAKVDDNQGQIVKALRRVGATVQSLAMVGSGVPDLLVGFCRQSYLLEVKQQPEPGKVRPSQCRLTPDETRWHAVWNGLPVSVVHNADEALRAIGAIP